MTTTTFSSGTTIASTWLNDVNAVTYSQVFYVDQYGAGTSKTGAQNVAGFAAAYAAAVAAGGGKLVFSPGTYACTTWPITLASGTAQDIELCGAGLRATSIVKSGGDTNPVISFSSSSATLVSSGRCEVSNMRIVGNAAIGPVITMTRMAQMYFRNVYIELGSVGIDLVASLILSFTNCCINNCATGLRTRKDGNGIRCNLITFMDGEINQNTAYGLDLGDCSSFVTIGTSYELNGTNGSSTTTGDVVIRSTCGDEAAYAAFNFINTWHEANWGRFTVENATFLRLKFDGMQSLIDTTYPNNVIVGAIAHMTVINSGFAGTFTVAASRFTAISSEFATLTNTSISYQYLGIKAGGVWKTVETVSNVGGGSLSIDSTSGALTLGTAGVSSPGPMGCAASTALTISSNVITPTANLHTIGAGLIKTITVPSPMSSKGGTFTVIPTAAFTTDVTGNIALASTATISRAMTFTFDNTANKWYPSY
jgi:hypothetical protein